MGSVADRITLAELEHDPYPILRTLQQHEPVSLVPALDMWMVTRWDDVVDVASSPHRFRAETEPSWLRDCLGENMLTLDGPAHDRLVGGMRPPFVAASCPAAVGVGLGALFDGLLDDWPDHGPTDAMAAYAEPLANLTLATALEWSVDWRELAGWCRGVCTGIANFDNDPAKAEVAAQAHAALADSIDSALARGEFERFVRAGFSRDEIVNNVRLMVSGGINEPRDGVGLVLWVLLERPVLLAKVRTDAGLLRRVVEETLRWVSPVGTATRQAVGDQVVGGVLIPDGAIVAACLGAANRDPLRWSNPDEFDPDRRDGAHIAFAVGEHRCLGEWLARQQIRVAVQRLLDRYPSLGLAEPVQLRGFEFRGPGSVMVEW